MAKRNTGRAALSFAAGFGKGYMDAAAAKRREDREDARDRREEERHRVDVRLSELAVQEKEDARQLSEALKRNGEDVKATEGYAVDTPDGRVIYANRGDAEMAASASMDEGVSMSPVFMAGGETFDTKDAANSAAARMNSPAARNRRAMNLARQYNNPQLAKMYADSYEAEINANKRDTFDQVQRAAMAGDWDQMTQIYKDITGTKRDLQIVPQADGTLAIMSGGQMVQQATPQQLLESTQMMIARGPDNMFEALRLESQRDLWSAQAADTREMTKGRAQQVANDTARANAAVTSAGAAAMNARTAADDAALRRRILTNPEATQLPFYSQDGTGDAIGSQQRRLTDRGWEYDPWTTQQLPSGLSLRPPPTGGLTNLFPNQGGQFALTPEIAAEMARALPQRGAPAADPRTSGGPVTPAIVDKDQNRWGVTGAVGR